MRKSLASNAKNGVVRAPISTENARRLVDMSESPSDLRTIFPNEAECMLGKVAEEIAKKAATVSTSAAPIFVEHQVAEAIADGFAITSSSNIVHLGHLCASTGDARHPSTAALLHCFAADLRRTFCERSFKKEFFLRSQAIR